MRFEDNLKLNSAIVSHHFGENHTNKAASLQCLLVALRVRCNESEQQVHLDFGEKASMLGGNVVGQDAQAYQTVLAHDLAFVDVHLTWIVIGLVTELTVTLLAFGFH